MRVVMIFACLPGKTAQLFPYAPTGRHSPKGVAIVSGIPAMRPWLTVADLIDSGEDLSLVANVLEDALEGGLVEDGDALTEKSTRGGCSYSFVNRFFD